MAEDTMKAVRLSGDTKENSAGGRAAVGLAASLVADKRNIRNYSMTSTETGVFSGMDTRRRQAFIQSWTDERAQHDRRDAPVAALSTASLADAPRTTPQTLAGAADTRNGQA